MMQMAKTEHPPFVQSELQVWTCFASICGHIAYENLRKAGVKQEFVLVSMQARATNSEFQGREIRRRKASGFESLRPYHIFGLQRYAGISKQWIPKYSTREELSSLLHV